MSTEGNVVYGSLAIKYLHTGFLINTILISMSVYMDHMCILYLNFYLIHIWEISRLIVDFMHITSSPLIMTVYLQIIFT